MKAWLKRQIGQKVGRDFLEKLTEYCIAEKEPTLSLTAAEIIERRGMSWTDHERDREILWRRFYEKLPAGPTLWLEFGVWKGDSMRYFATLDKHPESRFIGFDSFEGLPEDWRGMAAERFDVGGAFPDIDDPRVRFVKGWFQNTLPGHLESIASEAIDRKIIVHFDADLYSSTLYLLFTLSRIFDDYHCIFDEISGHETRALFNFLQATNWQASFSHRLDWEDFPQVAAGRLTMSKGQTSD